MDKIRPIVTSEDTLKLPSKQCSPISPEEDEEAREREVHKFYRPLEELYSEYTTRRDSETSLPLSGKSKLKPCPDRALTAFAQLGALRLNARRVIISLLDRRYQYVVAEATKTLSLQKHTASDLEDELSFGVATFQRSGTTCCEWATRLTHLAPPESLSLEPPDHPLIIPDLTLDERFCREPYVCERPSIRFCAGVPIISPSGHTIGAYSVLHDKPRDGLSAAEIEFVKDMAATVMSHLEMVRVKTKSQRSQDMVTGLGNFIAGRPVDNIQGRVERRRSEIYTEGLPSPDTSVPSSSLSQYSMVSKCRRVAKHEKSPQIILQPSQDPGAEQPIREEHGSDSPSIKSPHTSPQNTVFDPEMHRGNELQEDSLSPDTRDVFDRAARILRAAVRLDGAIFLDASIGTFGGLVKKAQRGRSPTRSPPGSSSSSGVENAAMDNKACLILGKSLGDHYGNAPTSSRPFSFPEHLLHSLLARYPKGKVWNYDEHDESATDYDTAKLYGMDGPINRRGQRWRERRLIQKIFPGVHSLAFIGMWDSNRERWFAGSVLWTCSLVRNLSPEIELNYLVAFGQSIMSEVAALDMKMADKAKTTFISSISHELRTPLHGILGSADCLQSTNLDAFQSTLLSTMDVCGKTLLETFDNLLSYAKINHMTSTECKDSTTTLREGKIETLRIGAMGPETDVSMGALIEEVVDTFFAGQEYLRTDSQRPAEGNLGNLASTAASRASSQKDISCTPLGLDSINLSVSYLNPGSSRWVFQTQPGAWRRVVMNLVGNAIKFTTKGSVAIRLDVIPIPGEEDSKADFKLVVADTGRGMGSEFAKTRLFTPFVQEDPLGPGTGLGMSIVKQIVGALNGTVSVKSRPKEGTEFSIVVPLAQAPKVLKASLFHTIPERCRGYRLAVLGNAIESNGLDDPVWTFADLCQKCFNMAVDFSSEPDSSGLYVTCEKHIRSYAGRFSSSLTQGYPRAKKVLIVLSKDSYSARALKSLKIAENTFDRVECISQPYGPTKLAKTLATCLDFLSGPFNSRRLSEQLGAADDPITRVFPTQRTPDASSAGRLSPPFRRGKSEPGPVSITWPNPSNLSQSTTPLVASIDAVVNYELSEGEDVLSSRPLEALRRPIYHNRNTNFGAHVAEKMTTEPAEPTHEPPLPLPMTTTITEPAEPVPPLSGRLLTKEMTIKPPELARALSEPLSTKTVTEQSEPSHTLSALLPISTSRPSVLLVDDNTVNLRLLAMFMQKQKRVYTLAENGLEALEAYRAAVPVVAADSPTPSKGFSAYEYVLIDIQMPVMDGLEATRQIRALERELKLKPAKIVALTGFATAGVQQESYASGVDLFLAKPVRMKEVMQIMEGT